MSERCVESWLKKHDFKQGYSDELVTWILQALQGDF